MFMYSPMHVRTLATISPGVQIQSINDKIKNKNISYTDNIRRVHQVTVKTTAYTFPFHDYVKTFGVRIRPSTDQRTRRAPYG